MQENIILALIELVPKYIDKLIHLRLVSKAINDAYLSYVDYIPFYVKNDELIKKFFNLNLRFKISGMGYFERNGYGDVDMDKGFLLEP